MSQWIVSFDTDRIKEYVFATDKLREIRGASRLLVLLNEERTREEIYKVCPEYEEIFFAGGSGAVLVPSKEKAEQIILVVENLYQRETYTASITGVAVPLAPATKTNDFGKRMELAGLRLRMAKDRKARRYLPTIQPYIQICNVCEQYPASRVSLIDSQPVCESCFAKRDIEGKRRKIEETNRANDPTIPLLAEDLNNFGELSHPKNYLGFIYADGNNMGTLLSEMDSIKNFQDLSEGLNNLIIESIKKGFEYQPFRSNKSGELIQSYEPLLIGGDDLMIVTVADIALDAAVKIAEYFEEKSCELLEKVGLSSKLPCLTLGVGVVLAHAKFPIAAYNRLALQLQRKAKQRCALEGYKTSVIDFMVVNAAGSDDLATLRAETLTEKTFVFPHDYHVNLTQRPHTLSEMKELMSYVQQFKRLNFPRSQLQFLYEGLFQSQSEAVFRWGQVAGRVKTNHRKLMDAFETSMLGAGSGGFAPWRKENESVEIDYSSALGDLVEIYQFVGKGDGE